VELQKIRGNEKLDDFAKISPANHRSVLCGWTSVHLYLKWNIYI